MLVCFTRAVECSMNIINNAELLFNDLRPTTCMVYIRYIHMGTVVFPLQNTPNVFRLVFLRCMQVHFAQKCGLLFVEFHGQSQKITP